MQTRSREGERKEAISSPYQAPNPRAEGSKEEHRSDADLRKFARQQTMWRDRRDALLSESMHPPQHRASLPMSSSGMGVRSSFGSPGRGAAAPQFLRRRHGHCGGVCLLLGCVACDSQLAKAQGLGVHSLLARGFIGETLLGEASTLLLVGLPSRSSQIGVV
jgi:hypothetical protein